MIHQQTKPGKAPGTRTKMEMDEDDLYCLMTWAWKNEGDPKADALAYLFEDRERIAKALALLQAKEKGDNK